MRATLTLFLSLAGCAGPTPVMLPAEPSLVVRPSDADDLSVRVLPPRTWFDSESTFFADPMVTMAVESPTRAVWVVESRMTQQMAMRLAGAVDLAASMSGRSAVTTTPDAPWFSISSLDEDGVVVRLVLADQVAEVVMNHDQARSIAVELRSAALARDVGR